MSRLDRISAEVTRKTGIDFEKYRSPEVIETLLETTSLITNPFSMLSTFVLSLLKVFAVLSLILTAWCYASGAPVYVVMLVFIVGYVGFPLIGFSYGITDVMKKIVGDMVDTVHLALDQSKAAITDLAGLGARGKMPPVADLFKGILLVVLLPAIIQIINDRVGLFGKPFTFVIERMLVTFNAMFGPIVAKLLPSSWTMTADTDSTGPQTQEMGPVKIAGALDKLKPHVEKLLVEKVLPKVRAPMRLLFYASSGITLLALVIVFWVMT